MNIFESVIDQTLKNYSPYVFDDPKSSKPKIKGRIRNKIINDVKLIMDKVPVIEVFIKGSILTKQYSKESDIDIFVRVKGPLYTEDQLRILLKPIWEKIDDTHLDGIPHPFQYYITKEKYNIDNTEAVYDIVGDQWIKRSPSKNIDINDYMDDFQKYVEQFSDFSEELRQSMIDYEILKDLPADEVKGIQNLLSQKLKDINEAIDGLGGVYTDLKNFRNESFAKDMTPSELKQYGIKTRLPGNVVFKLIERYHYLDLYRRIKKIIGSDGVLTQDEYEELNRVIKTKLTNEKTSFKTLFESPHKNPYYQRTNMIGQQYYNEKQYDETKNNWKLIEEFTFSTLPYSIYINEDDVDTDIRILSDHIKMVVATATFSEIDGRLVQSNIWKHNHLKEEIMVIYTIKILPIIKGNRLFSDTSQTPDGFRFWTKIFKKCHEKTQCGILNIKTKEIIPYTSELNLKNFYNTNKSNYIFFIDVVDPILTESSFINNLFGNTKGRKDLQHKPRHRQQQDNAGMLGHGTRKSLNLMPDYQRKDPRKSEGNINRAKATNRVIRVKRGSPQAMELAKKYRIDDPRGEKTVAGNQHDEGITIIFEESLDQKIKRAKQILDKYLK